MQLLLKTGGLQQIKTELLYILALLLVIHLKRGKKHISKQKLEHEYS